MFAERPISIAAPVGVPYPRSTFSWPVILKYLLLIGAAVYFFASIIFVYFTHKVYNVAPRMVALEQRQQELETKQAELEKRLHASSSELKHVVSTGVGSAQQAIDARTAELENQQKAAVARLAAAQTQESKQLAAVSGEIGAVKSDIGTAKADLQKTQNDLAATNAKLERAVGDLGIQSGLLARNAQELEVLRHKGERNYYDFTVQKNARVAVSTVSLVLKKVDPKKSKFTLNVIADDKTIEKKDRTVNEPLQFYSGRDHLLYELVVFTAEKNGISGYLTTPKDAPKPVTP